MTMQRQGEREDAPAVGIGKDKDIPAVRAYDRAGNGETHSDPVTATGDKRLENLSAGLVSDARARIGDLHIEDMTVIAMCGNRKFASWGFHHLAHRVTNQADHNLLYQQ